MKKYIFVKQKNVKNYDRKKKYSLHKIETASQTLS
jgi:hypothetical protein